MIKQVLTESRKYSDFVKKLGVNVNSIPEDGQYHDIKTTASGLQESTKPKEFNYNGMTFIFYPKGSPKYGYYFVHKQSGHGGWVTFSKEFEKKYGKPTLTNAERVFTDWVEDPSTDRLKVLNQYKDKYKE